MKLLTTLVFLVLSFSALNSVSAATPSFRTFDGQSFDQVKVQALASGKKVMWIASAAWCGPCAALEEFLSKHKGDLEPEISSFIIFHTEQTQVEFSAYSDIAPDEFFYVPTIKLYDPLTDRWSIISGLEDTKSAKVTLAEFLTKAALNPSAIALYEKVLNSGGSFDYSTPTGQYSVLDQALKATTLELSLADAGKFLKKIRGDAAAHPSQFKFEARYGLNDILNDAASTVIARGFSVADLRQFDPEIFTTVAAGSSVAERLNFSLPVRTLWRNGDYAAAATSCATLAPKRTSAKLQLLGKILCQELEVLAGTMDGAKVETFINTFSAAEQSTAAAYLVSLSLLVKRFDLAQKFQPLYKADMLKTYGGSATLKARIEASDQARMTAFSQNKIHP